MIFLNPFAWVFLPLVLSPLIWYFKFFRRKRRRVLPSIFFARKVSRLRKARSLKNILFELFLEILFLLCLLALFAQPSGKVFSAADSRNNLVVFLDNSPSMGRNPELRNKHYKQKVAGLLSSSKWTNIEMFDATMMLDSHEPYTFVQEEDNSQYLDEFFSNANLEWRSFQYRELSNYLENSLSYSPETYDFYVLSDLKSNHFAEPFELKSISVLMDEGLENEWTGAFHPVVRRDYTADRIVFVGEEVPLQFELTLPNASAGEAGEYTCEIFIDDERVYVNSLNFADSSRQLVGSAVTSKKVGVAEVKLTLSQNNNILYEYFSSFSVLRKVLLQVYGSPSQRDAFRNALAYDFKEGYISFGEKNAVKVFLGNEDLYLSSFNSLQKSILFMEPSKGNFYWGRFLEQKGFTDLALRREVVFPNNLSLEGKQILGDLTETFRSIGDLEFLRGRRVLYFGSLGTNTRLLLSVNNTPISFIENQTLFFPFGLATTNNSGQSFFRSPEGLLLFYEGLFVLLSEKRIVRANQNILKQFVSKRLHQNQNIEPFFREATPGIYHEDKEVFVVNGDPSEVGSEPIKKPNRYFRTFQKVQSAEVGGASQTLSMAKRIAKLLSLRTFLKLLCVAIAVYLMVAFLRRSNLIGKPKGTA